MLIARKLAKTTFKNNKKNNKKTLNNLDY